MAIHTFEMFLDFNTKTIPTIIETASFMNSGSPKTPEWKLCEKLR